MYVVTSSVLFPLVLLLLLLPFLSAAPGDACDHFARFSYNSNNTPSSVVVVMVAASFIHGMNARAAESSSHRTHP
jgi:hypothetical protein